MRGSDTAQCTLHEGGGPPAAYAREWLTLLRHSPWLWLAALTRELWILANQITLTGWSHRQWIFTQLTCILFYNFCKYNKNIATYYSFKCVVKNKMAFVPDIHSLLSTPLDSFLDKGCWGLCFGCFIPAVQTNDIIFFFKSNILP